MLHGVPVHREFFFFFFLTEKVSQLLPGCELEFHN